MRWAAACALLAFGCSFPEITFVVDAASDATTADAGIDADAADPCDKDGDG